MIYRIQKAKIHGASGKFRFQALQQRFNSHKSYWARTMREIEEGRYHRQTFRAEQRRRAESHEKDVLTTEDYLAINTIRDAQGEEAAAEAEAERRRRRVAELAAENDEAEAFLRSMGDSGATRPAAAPPSEEPIAMPPPAEGSGAQAKTRRVPPDIRGMSADEVAEKAERLREMRDKIRHSSAAIRARERAAARVEEHKDVDFDVFERFVAAKQRLQQSTDKLTFDAVKSSLEKQRAKVRQKHDCARVDFDVVIKDGNAYLKPIPVKDA